MEKFEKKLREKSNDSKYNVKAKIEEHLYEKGLSKKIIAELIKYTNEKNWPNPISSEKLRKQNKNIIETYSIIY